MCILGDDVMFLPEARVEDSHLALTEQITMNESLTNHLDERRLDIQRGTALIQELRAENAELLSKLEERFRSSEDLLRENEELRADNLNLVGKVEHLDRRLKEDRDRHAEDREEWFKEIDNQDLTIAGLEAMKVNYERWLTDRKAQVVMLEAEIKTLREAKSEVWEGDDFFTLSDESSDE